MALEIKKLTCPKCASPLELKNAGRSKSIVCPSCGSQIDLTSPDYQILGQVGRRLDPQVTQFKVGMHGPLDGQDFEIIGRVVYHDEEDDIWDEWLLLSAAGEYVWISDSENEGMALWRGFVPTEPVEPGKIAEGMRLNLRNATVTVRDVGRANIDYLEGELTWKAKVNDKMNYAEADGANQRISIEYTQNEIEFYWGKRLDRPGTARAFGVVAAASAVGGASLGKPIGQTFNGRLVRLLAIVLIFVIVGCVCLSVMGPASGTSSSGSSGTTSSGTSSSGSSSSWSLPSIRIGSSSSSSHSFGGGGGGSHGGGGGGGGGK